MLQQHAGVGYVTTKTPPRAPFGAPYSCDACTHASEQTVPSLIIAYDSVVYLAPAPTRGASVAPLSLCLEREMGTARIQCARLPALHLLHPPSNNDFAPSVLKCGALLCGIVSLGTCTFFVFAEATFEFRLSQLLQDQSDLCTLCCRMAKKHKLRKPLPPPPLPLLRLSPPIR